MFVPLLLVDILDPDKVLGSPHKIISLTEQKNCLAIGKPPHFPDKL